MCLKTLCALYVRSKREESSNTICNLTYLFLARGELVDVTDLQRALRIEHDASLQQVLGDALPDRLRRECREPLWRDEPEPRLVEPKLELGGVEL